MKCLIACEFSGVVSNEFYKKGHDVTSCDILDCSFEPYRKWSQLKTTDNVYDKMMSLPRTERERIYMMSPSENRGQLRSITYVGLAKAMAAQWGSTKERN